MAIYFPKKNIAPRGKSLESRFGYYEEPSVHNMVDRYLAKGKSARKIGEISLKQPYVVAGWHRFPRPELVVPTRPATPPIAKRWASFESGIADDDALELASDIETRRASRSSRTVIGALAAKRRARKEIPTVLQQTKDRLLLKSDFASYTALAYRDGMPLLYDMEASVVDEAIDSLPDIHASDRDKLESLLAWIDPQNAYDNFGASASRTQLLESARFSIESLSAKSGLDEMSSTTPLSLLAFVRMPGSHKEFLRTFQHEIHALDQSHTSKMLLDAELQRVNLAEAVVQPSEEYVRRRRDDITAHLEACEEAIARQDLQLAYYAQHYVRYPQATQNVAISSRELGYEIVSDHEYHAAALELVLTCPDKASSPELQQAVTEVIQKVSLMLPGHRYGQKAMRTAYYLQGAIELLDGEDGAREIVTRAEDLLR